MLSLYQVTVECASYSRSLFFFFFALKTTSSHTNNWCNFSSKGSLNKKHNKSLSFVPWNKCFTKRGAAHFVAKSLNQLSSVQSQSHSCKVLCCKLTEFQDKIQASPFPGRTLNSTKMFKTRKEHFPPPLLPTHHLAFTDLQHTVIIWLQFSRCLQLQVTSRARGRHYINCCQGSRLQSGYYHH